MSASTPSPSPAQASFTPGPWHVIPHAFPGANHRDRPVVDDAGDTIALIRGDGVVDSIRDGNANLVKSAPSLYAYAKAVALRSRWLGDRDSIGSTEWVDRLREFEEHLSSMGWVRGEASDPFLSTYRTTALALAEGK